MDITVYPYYNDNCKQELHNRKEVALEVSVDTWGNWERKRSFPDVPHIKKIQEVFNVAYDDIIFL